MASGDEMRVRRHLVINRETGTAEFREELLPAAKFGQRFAELKASLPDIGVEARLATLICNGCGDRAELDFDAVEYPDGWRELPGGDFCPQCSSGEPDARFREQVTAFMDRNDELLRRLADG